MPAPIAYRTLAEARAAARAVGGVLRGANAADPPPPAADVSSRLADTLERMADAVRLQTELLARLAPPPAPPAPSPVAPPSLPDPAPVVLEPAPAATPPPAPAAHPWDIALVRDPRTRRIAELQLRRPGDQAAAVHLAVVRAGPQQLIGELRLSGAAGGAVVRVARDRMSRRIDGMQVIPDGALQ
jgi:hypothetical protein